MFNRSLYLSRKAPQPSTKAAWSPIVWLHSPKSSVHQHKNLNRIVLILVHQSHFGPRIRTPLSKRVNLRARAATPITIAGRSLSSLDRSRSSSRSIYARAWVNAARKFVGWTLARSVLGGGSRTTEAAASIPLLDKVRAELSIRTLLPLPLCVAYFLDLLAFSGSSCPAARLYVSFDKRPTGIFDTRYQSFSGIFSSSELGLHDFSADSGFL